MRISTLRGMTEWKFLFPIYGQNISRYSGIIHIIRPLLRKVLTIKKKCPWFPITWPMPEWKFIYPVI